MQLLVNTKNTRIIDTMGQIIDTKCNNCGKHWRHYEGGGFIVDYY